MNWFGMTVILLLTVSAHAVPKPVKANIKVEGARFRSMLLAVPDVKVGGDDQKLKKFAHDLVTMVRNDLGKLSGVFKVIDPKSYIANPQKEGIRRENIKFSDWTNVGAEGLVKVEIGIDNGQAHLSAIFYQVALLKQSGLKSYHIPLSQAGRLAHKISDDAYQFFTGEKGYFSAKIAAIRESGGVKHVVIMDPDGENMRQVTRDSRLNMLPTWEPDGNTLLYTSFGPRGDAYLFEIKTDGTSKRTISMFSGLNMGAQVSRDQRKIALTLTKDGASQIYLADRNGKNPARITNTFGIDTSPFWFPDDKKIAFVSDRSGNPQIYWMNADGSAAERLTFQGKYNQTPRVSPKGDYIAFTGRDEENKFDIFLLDVKTKGISRVTQGNANNEDPWFTPNGNMVIFTSTRTGKREIFLSSLTGDNQIQITHGGQFWTPSFGPAPH